MSNNSSRRWEKYESKILIVGAMSSGKTNFLRKYTCKSFTPSYIPTHNLEDHFKFNSFHHTGIYNVFLYDVPGMDLSEKKSYYQGMHGAFVMFDATRKCTLKVALEWKEELDKYTNFHGLPDPLPVILLSNKIDLLNNDNYCGKTKNQMFELCKKHKFATWIEVSAKCNTNVNFAFERMFGLIGNLKDKKEIVEEKPRERRERSDRGERGERRERRGTTGAQEGMV
jgi:small GTP-binding protein